MMLVNDIRYQWVQTDYISRLKTLLVLFISNDRANTNLAILAFLYSGEFVKNPINFILARNIMFFTCAS